MMRLGFIKSISPIFSEKIVEESISALVNLRVDSAALNDFLSYASSLDEVRNIFLIVGESNVIVRVACQSHAELQQIIDEKISSRTGVRVVNSYIITRTIKDEQGIVPKFGIRFHLKCDYCEKEIKDAPFVLRVGEGERYFCCETCLAEYKEKFGKRAPHSS